MLRVISLLLLISTSAFAQPSRCNSDGSFQNELPIKMLAIHYADRSLSLDVVKSQAANVTITYVKPACGEDGLPLPWDQLHVQIVPK